MIVKKLTELAKSLLPYFMALFYPVQKAQGVVFGFTLQIVKALSVERSDISSKFYDYYFHRILYAKHHKQSMSIEPNIKELGDLIELVRLVKGITTTFFMFGYIILAGIMPLVAYKYLAIVFGAKFAMSLSGFLGTYYVILVVYLLYKKVVDLKPIQYLLKIFIRNEFAYILAKTSEIDDEVADITMQQVQESILLNDEKLFDKKFKKLEQDLGV